MGTTYEYLIFTKFMTEVSFVLHLFSNFYFYYVILTLVIKL